MANQIRKQTTPDAKATIFFFLLLTFVRLLFKWDYYSRAAFISLDINDSWIRYIRVRQWQVLDAVSRFSYTQSLLLPHCHWTMVREGNHQQLPQIPQDSGTSDLESLNPWAQRWCWPILKVVDRVTTGPSKNLNTPMLRACSRLLNQQSPASFK